MDFKNSIIRRVSYINNVLFEKERKGKEVLGRYFIYGNLRKILFGKGGGGFFGFVGLGNLFLSGIVFGKRFRFLLFCGNVARELFFGGLVLFFLDICFDCVVVNI